MLRLRGQPRCQPDGLFQVRQYVIVHMSSVEIGPQINYDGGFYVPERDAKQQQASCHSPPLGVHAPILSFRGSQVRKDLVGPSSY